MHATITKTKAFTILNQSESFIHTKERGKEGQEQ